MSIKVLYFARLAETLGLKQESIEATATVATVDQLIALLRSRGEPFDSAFDGDTQVLVAINQQMSSSSQQINDGDEVAFFPPVTGG